MLKGIIHKRTQLDTKEVARRKNEIIANEDLALHS
jgi:hypothetical protein